MIADAPARKLSVFDRVRLEILGQGLGADYRGMTLEEYADAVLDLPLWSKQREVFRSVEVNARTAVRSSHATGKSSGIARLAVAFLQTHEHSIVLTTAPNATQVREIMWRNIRTAAENARQPLLRKRGHPLQTKWEIGADWYATGVSPGKSNSGLQGYHASGDGHILVIVDEAAGVGEHIYEQIEGLMTSEGARLLLIGNPTSFTGSFRRAFHEGQTVYHTITISAEDSPNFTHFGITRKDIETGAWVGKVGEERMPYPGLATPKWAADIVELNGPDHPEVTSRVWAEWPTGGSFTLIALSDIEAAEKAEAPETDAEELAYAGIDVARFGDDETTIWVRRGSTTLGYRFMLGMDTVEASALWEEFAEELELRKDDTEVRVDTTGVGGGLADTIRHNGWRVKGVNFSAASSRPEQWDTAIDEYWWQLRTRFIERQIALPDGLDNVVRGQLSDIRYGYKSGKLKPKIEPKSERKKRAGGRSPDRAEAMMLAYADRVLDEREGKPKVASRTLAGSVVKSATFRKERRR